MAYEFRPLSDSLGVEVLGIDLSNGIDEDTLAAVNRAFVDNVHPVVRTHDETGAKAIYINPLRLKYFIGLGPEESTELVEALTEHATSARFTYAHSWRQGDLVVWDNRQAMHRVEHNYDLAEQRLMHRIILKGQRPV